jgi:hypothetical protein
MARRAAVVLVLGMFVAALAAWAGSAATRLTTQTVVFDAVVRGSFVDKPPTGPSPGDTELLTARLFDAGNRFVGTARDTCVFTKVIPHDVLERCSGSAKTTEGAVTLAGVGHLYSMNPPWKVGGRSGAYKGLHGTQVFATDIPLDPNVPLAAGRSFSVIVIKVTGSHRFHVGVVPRPAANAEFIRRASAACHAAEAKAARLPPFSFSNFDPFHPDKKLLPEVGRFFDQPSRRQLPRALLQELRKLGQPPRSRQAWNSLLKARSAAIMNETKQTKAALADNAPAFVRSVYQASRSYNQLVFRSAVFGVQSCTFS